MKELWHRTADIFWEHPVLWLPVMAADLLGWCVTQLQRLLTHEIVLSLVQRHSVLGGVPDSVHIQSSIYMKVALLTALLVWGSYFIDICLYTTAFLVTARLVSGFHRHLPPGLRSALSAVTEHRRRISGFAWKVFGMFVLAAIVLGVASQLVIHMHEVALLKASPFAVGAAIVVHVCVAYCVVPSALRLLRGADALPVTPETVRIGRSIAIPVVVALPVIAFCVQRAEWLFVGASPVHAITRLVAEAIASLIVAFLYAPLFIALSLVAIRNDELQTPVLEDV